MVSVPIITGTVADATGDFLTSYPINREPFGKAIGLSQSYLAMAAGIREVATGPGPDRGGICWMGVCYRVMGTKLVRVNEDWSVDVLGDVGGANDAVGGICALDYSFTSLIINSGMNLFYWNPTDGLVQVVDENLGNVIDVIWVDGYTMTTDGTDLVVTELNDPTAVNPLNYGDAEQSPAPTVGLLHMRGEVYVFGEATIEVFQDIGGLDFPFQAVPLATVPYGCVGSRAKCKYLGTAAFVGGPVNGAPGVWLMGWGTAEKISSAEVDADLAALTDAERAALWCEARVMEDDQRLLIHTPYRTWGYSQNISGRSGGKMWVSYVSSLNEVGAYQGRGLVWCYGQWIVGNSEGKIGVLDDSIATHFGKPVAWRFDTTLLYNEAKRGILTRAELVGTPGNGPHGAMGNGRIALSYTKDGQIWSMPRAVSTGRPGNHRRRLAWRPGVRFENWVGLRFSGADNSLASVAMLECDVEPLGA